MRILKIMSLCLMMLVLFTSCGASQTAYSYPAGEHTHVFGNRYDVVNADCVTAGQEVRYCKICHLCVTDTVAIPTDIAARRHDFSATVVPPTESTEGYTVLECTLCDYVVERTEVIAPLFALKTDEDLTVRTAPSGVRALLMADTVDLVLRYDVGGQTVVDATLARRLAVMLTVTEELEREDAMWSADTVITLTGALSGSYSVRTLLRAWLREGDASVARAFAEAFSESDGAFAVRVNERLRRLGVLDEVSANVFGTGESVATLRASAIMLARALATPLLVDIISDEVPPLLQVAGRTPIAFFEYATLRVVVIPAETGYRFLLLDGEEIEVGLENELLAY